MTVTMSSNTVKAVMVGDSCCGKSSMVSCLLQSDTQTSATNVLKQKYVPTIFDVYRTTTDTAIRNSTCNITIHDTAGLEVYDRLRPLSYPDTDIILLCFSIAEPDSLRNVLDKWLPEIRHNCPDRPFLLVGTKSDLRADDRIVRKLNLRAKQEPVSRNDGIKIAKQIKALKYMECSALDKDSIQTVFDYATKKSLKQNSSHICFSALSMAFKMLKRQIKLSAHNKTSDSKLLLA